MDNLASIYDLSGLDIGMSKLFKNCSEVPDKEDINRVVLIFKMEILGLKVGNGAI